MRVKVCARMRERGVFGWVRCVHPCVCVPPPPVQKVMEAYRDRGNAQTALDALVSSEINRKIGPAYRSYIMQYITNARVQTAQRQVRAS
jgi:hypothetical protein